MTKDISNSDDTIDSRDVIKRIEELEEERDSFQEDNELPDYIDPETTTNDKIKEWTDDQLNKWVEWDESDEGQELKALQAFADEFEGYCSDWNYGVTLVRESYWVEYAKEYVKDCYSLGDIPSILQDNINWEGVSEDLQQDYASGDWDGVTYWAR